MTEKSLKTHKKTSFRPKLSSLHIVCTPAVIPFDNFTDALGLFKYYIFGNMHSATVYVNDITQKCYFQKVF